MRCSGRRTVVGSKGGRARAELLASKLWLLATKLLVMAGERLLVASVRADELMLVAVCAGDESLMSWR